MASSHISMTYVYVSQRPKFMCLRISPQLTTIAGKWHHIHRVKCGSNYFAGKGEGGSSWPKSYESGLNKCVFQSYTDNLEHSVCADCLMLQLLQEPTFLIDKPMARRHVVQLQNKNQFKGKKSIHIYVHTRARARVCVCEQAHKDTD